MKLVISDPETGKAYQVDLGEKSARLYGLKIGDTLEGDSVGLPGYLLRLTGGSDASGFPMVQWLEGTGKKKLLLRPGVGFRGKPGERRKKTVRGNTYSPDIVQANAVVERKGEKSLEELLGQKDATGS